MAVIHQPILSQTVRLRIATFVQKLNIHCRVLQKNTSQVIFH